MGDEFFEGQIWMLGSATSAMLLGGCAGEALKGGAAAAPPIRARIWLTTPDRVALLAEQPAATQLDASASLGATITIDPTQRFQTMVGFGASI